MPRAYRTATLIVLLLPQLLHAQSVPKATAPTAAKPAATATVKTSSNYASAGQTALPNALALSVGGGLLQLRDEALLPVIHSGAGTAIGAEYRRNHRRNLHRVELQAQIYSTSSRVDEGSQYIGLGMHYRYLRLLTDLGEYNDKHIKPASLWLGARLGGGPTIQSYPQIDEAHAYWNTQYQLNPIAMIYWQAKPRLAWINELELPLLGTVSRPAANRTYFNDIPYFTETMALAHTDMRVRFAHQAGSLRLTTALEYPLHRRVLQRVGYQLAYDYARPNAQFQALNHSLHWQTAWSF